MVIVIRKEKYVLTISHEGLHITEAFQLVSSVWKIPDKVQLYRKCLSCMMRRISQALGLRISHNLESLGKLA